MKTSRQELKIDFINRGIFKNNLITLFTCFDFVPKTGLELAKTGVIFHCELTEFRIGLTLSASSQKSIDRSNFFKPR